MYKLINLVEYFDPINQSHIDAWDHLNEYGDWPDYFKREMEDNNTYIPLNWHLKICKKLAHDYCNKLST